MKILLDMYLNKNLGDDLFLQIISNRYPDVLFYVKPYCKYKKNLYNKNVIFKRSIFSLTLNYISNKLHLYKYNTFNYYKKRTDCIVTLGGSMFIENDKNDYEKTLLKYNKKNYFIIGSNFGPYSSSSFFKLYEEIFKHANDVCFRDMYSYNLFNHIKSVRQATDIVFSLKTENIKLKNEKKVVFSIINLKNRPNLKKYEQHYINFIMKAIEYFQKQNYTTILMSFCKAEGDEEIINEIYNKIKDHRSINKYFYNGNTEEAINVLSSSEYIISTRFHAMILGFLLNKKVIPIIYSKKMENIINDLKFDGCYYNITNIDKFVLNKDIEKIKKLNYNMENLRIQANKQFEKLDIFINSNKK